MLCLLCCLSTCFACKKNCTPTPVPKLSETTRDPKIIYLTFDDGPSGITETILNTLKLYNVKATFFIIGKNVKSHRDTLKRIFIEGHTVGIHSNTHVYKEIYLSSASLKYDINACLTEIKGVNENYTPYLYRFPGGSFTISDELKNTVKNMGLKYVDWNASCRDAEINNANKEELFIQAKQTSNGKDKVIMLMHDSQTKLQTALALPKIIEYFYSRGYDFKAM